GSTVEQRYEGAAAGEPDGGLPGGVAAADDGDARGAAQLRLGRPGRVEHAHALVVGQAVEGEPPVGGAGGEHDGACCDLVLLFQPYEVSSVGGLERDRAVGGRGSGTKLPCLADGTAGQLAAADARGEAEVVLDPARRSVLAAERGALDDQRVESLGGAVNGGGEAGGAAADHEQVDLLARRQLASDPERTQHLTPRGV